MPIVMRVIQQFEPAKRQQFMDLEKQFAELEAKGILPCGERMTPIAAKEPGNTFIWQSRFPSLAEAEKAFKLFETSPEHTVLFDQQVIYLKNAWVELYNVLEF